MAMALKADVEKACSKSGIQKPIDLVHLSKMTLGDWELELDLLKMFSSQLCQYEQCLETSTGADSIKRLAHTIKGAAKSIGAFQLSAMAENAEKSGEIDHQKFNNEIDAIKRYISELVKSK